MKKYIAPLAEVFGFRLEDVLLESSIPSGGEYGGGGATDDGGDDPF